MNDKALEVDQAKRGDDGYTNKRHEPRPERSSTFEHHGRKNNDHGIVPHAE